MGPRAKECRGELREALKRVLALAREREAELLLIAGDLFEHPRVSRDTVSFLQDALHSLKVTQVCIAPGNHDPYLSESPYATATWPDNVHIFCEDRWTTRCYPSLGVCVHGIAHTSFGDNAFHLGELLIGQDNLLHIALMHGSDLGDVPPPYANRTYFPFRREELEHCGAHYVALGHYHCFRTLATGSSRPIGCYSGCPEGTGFDDEGNKVAVVVQLDPSGPILEPVTTCRRQYVTEAFNCSGVRSREEIIQRLRAMVEERGWGGWLARIVLEGNMEPSVEFDLEDLAARGRGGLFHLELIDHTRPPYDVDRLRREQSARGEFVRRMERLLSELPADEENERATLTLALTYGLDAFFQREISKR